MAVASGAVQATAEQVLIKHGFDLVLCGSASLLVEIVGLSKLTEDLESGPFGATSRLRVGRGLRRQVVRLLSLGKFLKKHLRFCFGLVQAN